MPSRTTSVLIQHRWLEHGRAVLLLASVAEIVLLTLLPAHGPHDLELRPFSDIGPALRQPLAHGHAAGAVGNLLLFLPFGAALCLRRWRLGAAAGAGLAFSVSIELAQLALPGRTTSVDDVILNTLGAAAGWAFVALLRRLGVGRA